MSMTSIHDLKPNRTVSLVSGVIFRCYPVSMVLARDRWLPFRNIVVADESGWIRVKVWGSYATELLRGQQIRLQKVFCFHRNQKLYLSVGSQSHLKICTQA